MSEIYPMKQVPVQKLVELEESRIKLYAMAKAMNFNTWQIMELQAITSVMWELANRKIW